MEIAKWILIGIYILVAVILIILTLIQTKEDAGLSATIADSSTNNFYEKSILYISTQCKWKNTRLQ